MMQRRCSSLAGPWQKCTTTVGPSPLAWQAWCCARLLDSVHGQQLERPSLKLGVANKSHLYYLPVTVAERRGHFSDYGLTVTMSDFEGGGQSFEALLAGSVDIVAGAYEHTLRAQSQGSRRPRRDRARPVSRRSARCRQEPAFQVACRPQRPENRRDGPDSSSHFFVLYLMARPAWRRPMLRLSAWGGGRRQSMR